MTEHDDLIQRLHSMGTQPIDGPRQSADLTAMAGVRAPRLRSKLRLAGAFLAGLLIGSTGLAAADVLPDPAQHAAHTVLSRVGVQVPDPERYHDDECGAEVKKNHGAYVKVDHALAQSDCGKKVGAGAGGDGTKDAKADRGPCHGKPSWAGDKTMTDEAKAAAEAARDAQCPDEADEVDAPETQTQTETETEADAKTDEPTIQAPADEPTTTTEAPTTTTTVAESTTTTV